MTEPVYDPDAEPIRLGAPEDDDELVAELRPILYQLRRIAHAKDALDEEREAILAKGVELQRRIGRPITFIDPLNGKALVAGVRQTEKLEVDAGQLLQALVDYHGDPEVAEMYWRETLKPPEVDTKQGGLLEQVMERSTSDNPTIPRSVLAKVGRLKAIKPYIGFSRG